jgi:hypothetical protein
MAALPHIDDLRRHAAPQTPIFEGPPFFEETPPAPVPPRPELRAAWHQDAAGKLVCHWTAHPRA